MSHRKGSIVMTMLHSLAEFESLVENRPEHSRTYQIDPAIATEVRKAIPVRRAASGPVREMNPAEMRELASYLEIPVSEFRGPYSVSDITCRSCGRHLTMLDFAKTSVDAGLHSKALVAQVLTGRAGIWVTIRGLDGGRYANCAACGQQSHTRFIHYACDPSFPTYEYA
jgi:hypothetical protein